MDADAVGGSVQPGFEAVRDAFIENFERRNELGAACCVYHRGEKVVDLWGGVRDRATGDPWEEDTMALVFSATKGISALAMALAHSRGLFDYDEPVGTYWPEFGRHGQGPGHGPAAPVAPGRAARPRRIPDPGPRRRPDRLAAVLARQTPAWEPGTRQAYHGITIGFYESELLRRVDPGHRSLGPVLPGGDRRSARPRVLHPAARGDPERPAGAAREAAQHGGDDLHDAPPARALRDEPALPHPQDAAGVGVAGGGQGARLRPGPGGAGRGRRRDGAGHGPRLRRLRDRGGESSGCARRRSGS
jgi:hypothetical protein